MSPDRLVYMANQIGTFFASQSEDQAVSGTLDHIRKFWDPRMRAEIIAHAKAGGQGLHFPALQAVEQLAKVDAKG
jgi:formate dehydrogenase subunit delta